MTPITVESGREEHTLDNRSERPLAVVVQSAQKLRNNLPFQHDQEILPWRSLRTPYRVFLAEFLLVRTRSDVVARLFEEIVARYPDVSSLANADPDELVAALEPLGLKKRVPLLLRGAQYLMEYHAGQIPEKLDDLMRVPGLGLYTAAAIAAFAYHSSEVPADVNILRFLSRLTGLPMKHPTKGSETLRALLPLLSRDQGGPEPERLLDFSRLICRPRNPRCRACPLQEDCQYSLSVCADRPDR